MPVISTRGTATAQGFGLLQSTKVDIVIPNLGDPFQGGFYAGIMSPPDGNLTYALVISPKAQGQIQAVNGQGGAGPSRWDGLTNTKNGIYTSVNAFARGLTIGGFTDWYIPAIDELELLYRNLKPTTTPNVTGSVPPNSGSLITSPNGFNPSSLPRGSGYTTTFPAQARAVAFHAGGSECLDTTAFPVATWSSTAQTGATQYIYFQRHDAGEENVALGGGNTLTVRAIRRYIISQ